MDTDQTRIEPGSREYNRLVEKLKPQWVEEFDLQDQGPKAWFPDLSPAAPKQRHTERQPDPIYN